MASGNYGSLDSTDYYKKLMQKKLQPDMGSEYPDNNNFPDQNGYRAPRVTQDFGQEQNQSQKPTTNVSGGKNGSGGSAVAGVAVSSLIGLLQGKNPFYNDELDKKTASAKKARSDAANFDQSTDADYGINNPLNTERYVNTKQLQDQKDMLNEQRNSTLQTALQNARINSALKGTPGGYAQNANVTNVANSSAQQAGQMYANMSQIERKNAYNRLIQAGNFRRQGLINKANEEMYMLSQEQPGLLQNPELIQQLVSGVADEMKNDVDSAPDKIGNIAKGVMAFGG